MRSFFICMIGVFILHGCSSSFFNDSEKIIYEYADQINREEIRLNSYLGKTKSEIVEMFKNPKAIYKANPPSYNLPLDADEMWRYESLNKSTASNFIYNFLFKEGRLIKVMVS